MTSANSAELPELPPLPASVHAGKMVVWSKDRLLHRPCPACGADAARPVCRRPDALVVSRCTACDMRYLADIPSATELAAFYRNYGEYKRLTPQRLGLKGRLLNAWRPDPHLTILLETGGLRGRRVCEVGCSYGIFLRALRQEGAEVHGVEVDQQALAHLAAQGIASGPTLEASAGYDVICAFQLIEHLPDPAAWLAQASQALRPDGRLLLALPNGGEAERVGASWLGYRVDLEHLNYFSPGTLAEALRRQGLYLEMLWEHTQPAIRREGDGSQPSRGWAGRLRLLLTLLTTRPVCLDGTFVLTALARKAGR